MTTVGLEPSRQNISIDGSQHMLFWSNMENYPCYSLSGALTPQEMELTAETPMCLFMCN